MTAFLRTGLIASLLLATSGVTSNAGIAESPAAPSATTAPSAAPAITPEDVVLAPRTVAFVVGKGKWDDAEAVLDTAFKSIYAAMARETIHPAGVPMVEYLDSDDSTFSFKAMVPIQTEAGAKLGPDVLIGDGPSGRVLKFEHRGSFDDLEQVYNRIDDYLASKSLTMTKVVEEYVTDPMVTTPNNTVTEIYVFTQ